MALVYLSSAPPDVIEYQSAAYEVLKRLGHLVVGPVAFGTGAQSSIETRPVDIADADVVVVILGWTFGTPPPGGGGQSLLEFEYQQARSIKRPTLIFLMRGEPRVQSEGGEGIPDPVRVKRFRELLARNQAVDFFASVEEFRERLATAIADWERRRDARPPTVTVEQLPLAWRLVVDFKGKPDLLRHLDAGAFTKALERWEEQAGADSRKPWPERLERALSELESKQLPHAPNPLWLAWMRATQAPEPPAHDGGPRPTPVHNERPMKQAEDGPRPSTKSSPEA